MSGRSAARLAHQSGGLGVGGSNPLAPTIKKAALCRYFNGVDYYKRSPTTFQEEILTRFQGLIPSITNMIHPGPDTRGFTLIELSIVLVIIGLIIGGVLFGRDLIAAAEIRKQVSQVERYKTALMTFRGKYGQLPGDMDPSTASALGFVTRSGLRGYGDNNGVLEGGNWGWNCTDGEDAYVWLDLSDARLIDQTIAVASYGTTNVVPKGILPNTNLLAWSPCQAVGACPTPGIPGTTYLALCTIQPGGVTCLAGLTPFLSQAIDAKVDDGKPQTGTVTAFSPVVWTGNNQDWLVNAAVDDSTTCFNNSTNAYSTNINGGNNVTCNVSFVFIK